MAARAGVPRAARPGRRATTCRGSRREFKDSLNKNTIRDIATFFAQLSKQETVDQGAGRTDQRLARPRSTTTPAATSCWCPTARRASRSGTSAPTSRPAPTTSCPTATEQYSEQKFLQVKTIIDRFRGREGSRRDRPRVDRRVTDVRNWFVFSASERWRERRQRVRELHRLGRQVRRPEGEARLHDPGRRRWPTSSGWTGATKPLQVVPLRGDRRGVRPRLGRVDPLRLAAVHPAGPAAADRHPAAEDPRDRAARARRRLRRQSQAGDYSRLQGLTITEYRDQAARPGRWRPGRPSERYVQARGRPSAIFRLSAAAALDERPMAVGLRRR